MPRRAALFLSLGIAAWFVVPAWGALPPAPCEPEGALPAREISHDADGIFLIDGHYRLRLANIVWPDHLEPNRRVLLSRALAEGLHGEVEISWKPAAGPDRWGITPAHLFLREKNGNQPPFWLQAGLVENGHVPAWPDAFDTACRDRLGAFEREAIRLRRGYWAPRAQAARHRAIALAPEAHAGRKLVSLWKVRSAKAWRMLLFVNFMPSFRGAPALALTRKQVDQFVERGQDPNGWGGKTIVVRFVLGAKGLARIRIETPDHATIMD